jgi:hypothetical protein
MACGSQHVGLTVYFTFACTWLIQALLEQSHPESSEAWADSCWRPVAQGQCKVKMTQWSSRPGVTGTSEQGHGSGNPWPWLLGSDGLWQPGHSVLVDAIDNVCSLPGPAVVPL